LAVVATLALAACSSPATQAPVSNAPSSEAAGSFAPTSCATGTITAAGSTALQPLVTMRSRPDLHGGLPRLDDHRQRRRLGHRPDPGRSGGSIDIGDSDVTAESKLATPDAAALVDHMVAKQGWIVVANKDVTGITNLTTAQLARSGPAWTTNWKDVGGPDLPIVLILRPTSSGTRATFKKIVLGGATEASGQALTEDSNGAVTAAVAGANGTGGTPGSTSVIGFAYYQHRQGQPGRLPARRGRRHGRQHGQRHVQAERRRPHVHQGRRRPAWPSRS
jgi:phosphate transport system substrate-binding protein